MFNETWIVVPISIEISVFKWLMRTMVRCIEIRFYIIGVLCTVNSIQALLKNQSWPCSRFHPLHELQKCLSVLGSLGLRTSDCISHPVCLQPWQHFQLQAYYQELHQKAHLIIIPTSFVRKCLALP